MVERLNGSNKTMMKFPVQRKLNKHALLLSLLLLLLLLFLLLLTIFLLLHLR